MPKASPETAKRLARLSTDCSFLLTHLIRQNGDHPKKDQEARDVLLSILGLPSATGAVLKGGGVGWYTAAPAQSFDPATWDFKTAPVSRAVCFTESTLAGLRAHRDVFDVKYGLAFDRDWLFDRGANPCLNIREDIFKTDVGAAPGQTYSRHVFSYIPTQLHPFMNIISGSFDATHEREWRLPGDLAFSPADLRFVFCPQAEFPMFAALQTQGLPNIFDLEWLDRV